MDSWSSFRLTTNGLSWLCQSKLPFPQHLRSLVAGTHTLFLVGSFLNKSPWIAWTFFFLFRNAKRFPLTPSFLGQICQVFMVMSLLFPKIILASATFVYVPYFFSVALIVEFVLLMLYRKAFFGQFGFSEVFSYATLISPALFEMPPESRCKTNSYLNA